MAAASPAGSPGWPAPSASAASQSLNVTASGTGALGFSIAITRFSAGATPAAASNGSASAADDTIAMVAPLSFRIWPWSRAVLVV